MNHNFKTCQSTPKPVLSSMLQPSFAIRHSPFVILLAAWLSALPIHAGGTAVNPTAGAARGLIERVVPKQAEHFVVETIPAAYGRDVFEIESRGGQIVLRGNDGVSVASALNWYLQNQCHCDISWNCGNQLNLPKPLPLVPEKVRVISPHRYRYAYNFCTHGYTMAWWDWPQWRRELDYLALTRSGGLWQSGNRFH
jgi:alpha-N-acetylglucosaminidase